MQEAVSTKAQRSRTFVVLLFCTPYTRYGLCGKTLTRRLTTQAIIVSRTATIIWRGYIANKRIGARFI